MLAKRDTRRLVRRLPVTAALLAASAAGCTTSHAGNPQATETQRPVRSPASTPVAVPATRLAPQRAIAEWQLHGNPIGFTTGSRASTTAALTVAKDIHGTRTDMQQVALVFPAPRVPAGCITRVELALSVLGIHGSGADLGLYPSDEANYLATAHQPNSQLDLSRLIDNRPRGFVSYAKKGRTTVDLTALYRTWARGGPFPSQGARVSRHTPFAVILRPSTAEEGRSSIVLANDAGLPRLVVYRRAGC